MVKGVATSIITVAVLMGSLVACGGSDNQLSEEEKNEWIVLCSAVVKDYNCAQLAQAMGELITDNVVDKACMKEEMLIFAGYTSNSTNSEAQYKRMQDLCRKDKEEETSLSDESESSPPPTSTPVPTAEPEPTPTPVPEPTPTLEPTPTPIPQPQDQIYFRNRNELFSMNADGTNVIQLTDIANIENSEYSYEYEIYSVQASPNGEKILYELSGRSRQFNEDGSYKSVDELWVVDVENANSIQVAIAGSHDTYEYINYSQWSSDSSRIYFNISGKNYVMNSDGTAKRQDGCNLWNSAFSPDGRRIAHGDYQIYVSDNFCGNEQQVTNEVDKMFSGLVWSPDGTKIAADYFMGCRQCIHELYIADMTPYVYDNSPSPTFENNPNLGQITDSVGGVNIEEVNWSPDSKSIVFTQLQSQYDGTGAIYVADLDENGINFRWLANGFSPKYFPEEEKIAFTRWSEEDLQERYHKDKSPPEIFTMNADGTNIISTGQYGYLIAVKP